jgi:uncharacterized protein YebE (UPF0316 family)
VAAKKRIQSKKQFPYLSIILILIAGVYIISFGYKIANPVQYRKIKIEILNGCGVQDLARVTTDYLREKGFDVINYANAAEEQKKTVVIDRLSPEEKWAKIVASVLDIDLTSAIVDSSLCVHVLVLLGKDYEEIMPKKILMERRLLENQQ